MNAVNNVTDHRLIGPVETKADAFYLFGRRCARMGLKRETATQVLGGAASNERIERFWAGYNAPRRL